MRRLLAAATPAKRILGVAALASAALLSAATVASAAQARQAKPAAAAAETPASNVDKVIDLVTSGLSEDLVLRAITRENLTQELTSSDMIRMKKAGVSDRVIAAMEPAAAPAAPAAPTPAAAPAAPAASSAPASAPAAQLPRAAIDEFDFSTVHSLVSAVFGTNVDIGKGIRALLTTRVQQGGKLRVVERAKVDTVMKEQDLGASNRVKRGSNARVGQILGAEVYMMGDIVAFGRDDQRKGVSLGTFGVRGPIGGVRVGGSEGKAVIVVNYRLVDAETSEVIDSGEARGESSRSSKGLAGMFGVGGRVAGGSVDMTSRNFAETIIGEATIDVVNKLADVLNAKAGSLPARQIDIEARVAAVNGRTITLAAGSGDGVAVGDRFDVFRILGEIKDPVSGEVLDLNVEKVGELTIDSVRDRIATGSYAGQPVTPKDGLARKRM
jgi:curli biogenesis system outer membrane secretion channel CsgG